MERRQNFRDRTKQHDTSFMYMYEVHWDHFCIGEPLKWGFWQLEKAFLHIFPVSSLGKRVTQNQLIWDHYT